MIDSTTPRYPTIRVNLLRSHGSPTDYLYKHACCRCALCRAVNAKHVRNRRAARPGKRAKYDRNYRANHREEVAAYDRGRRKAYPDNARTRNRNYRARKLATEGTHTVADITAQYKRQKGRCFWGRKINPDCAVSLKAGYHVDHVVPLAGERASSNGTENLVLACPSCNRHKNATHPMDFAGILF